MIRQAISCDICGTEMLNANHWFVACDSGPELSISVWNPRIKFRASMRHLCGHKCLHKLVDDFTARALTVGLASAETSEFTRKAARRSSALNDTKLAPLQSRPQRSPTVIGACTQEPESSARLIWPARAEPPRVVPDPAALRAEAWKRERERLRQAEQMTSSRRAFN